MSKASEWLKKQKELDKLIPVMEHGNVSARLIASDDISIQVLTLDGSFLLTQEQAIAVAKWILDVCEETNEQSK